jgi:hypothetical protein
MVGLEISHVATAQLEGDAPFLGGSLEGIQGLPFEPTRNAGILDAECYMLFPFFATL